MAEDNERREIKKAHVNLSVQTGDGKGGSGSNETNDRNYKRQKTLTRDERMSSFTENVSAIPILGKNSHTDSFQTADDLCNTLNLQDIDVTQIHKGPSSQFTPKVSECCAFLEYYKLELVNVIPIVAEKIVESKTKLNEKKFTKL